MFCFSAYAEPWTQPHPPPARSALCAPDWATFHHQLQISSSGMSLLFYVYLMYSICFPVSYGNTIVCTYGNTTIQRNIYEANHVTLLISHIMNMNYSKIVINHWISVVINNHITKCIKALAHTKILFTHMPSKSHVFRGILVMQLKWCHMIKLCWLVIWNIKGDKKHIYPIVIPQT